MFWRMLHGKPRVAPIGRSASGSAPVVPEQRVVPPPVLGEEEVRTRLYGRVRTEHPALEAAAATRPRADRRSA